VTRPDRRPASGPPGPRGSLRLNARLCSLAIGLGWMAACGARDPAAADPEAVARARSRGAAAEREWRSYLGDAAVSHSSPLTQINRTNVAALEVAWRYDAGEASPVGGSQIQFNPLVVKGILYGGSPTLRLFALDASTGEELWSFRPDGDAKAWSANRGVSYWEQGAEERLLYGAGPYLYALDPRTGRRIAEFGKDGRVDLREGLGRDVGADAMGVVATTPPAVFEDLVILGGRVNEAVGAAPGHVRAYDVRTGEMRWIFHTIPQPGEPGHETWPENAWRTAGGANAWAGISVDVERALVFVPTGSATPDFFGGDRVGDDLFANSVVALDARTGERRWHFQTVRHDLWDRDLPAPPNLVEIERDGQRIPAVAQVTKTGDTFVFHRETGEPLFPIREEPVVGAAVPGEWTAKSQPLPVRPPPFVPHGFDDARVSDRSPEAARFVRARIAGMRRGSLYAPPSVEGTLQLPGTDGGAEWGGAAWDAGTGLLTVNANQVPWVVQMVEVAADANAAQSLAQGYLSACAGCHGLDLQGDGSSVPSLLGVGSRIGPIELYRIIRDGRGRMPALGGVMEWWQIAALSGFVYTADEADAPIHLAKRADGPTTFTHGGYRKLVDPEGRPGSKPPWGTLTAIDLSAGEIRWQVPLGDYPEILAAGERGLGAENYGGPVVTAGGLLFIAATPDARFRAFDAQTGELLWETGLPAGGFATPASYEADGRQFVVVAAGGGKLAQPSGSEYLAFALPRGR